MALRHDAVYRVVLDNDKAQLSSRQLQASSAPSSAPPPPLQLRLTEQALDQLATFYSRHGPNAKGITVDLDSQDPKLIIGGESCPLHKPLQPSSVTLSSSATSTPNQLYRLSKDETTLTKIGNIEHKLSVKPSLVSASAAIRLKERREEEDLRKEERRKAVLVDQPMSSSNLKKSASRQSRPNLITATPRVSSFKGTTPATATTSSLARLAASRKEFRAATDESSSHSTSNSPSPIKNKESLHFRQRSLGSPFDARESRLSSPETKSITHRDRLHEQQEPTSSLSKSSIHAAEDSHNDSALSDTGSTSTLSRSRKMSELGATTPTSRTASATASAAKKTSKMTTRQRLAKAAKGGNRILPEAERRMATTTSSSATAVVRENKVITKPTSVIDSRKESKMSSNNEPFKASVMSSSTSMPSLSQELRPTKRKASDAATSAESWRAASGSPSKINDTSKKADKGIPHEQGKSARLASIRESMTNNPPNRPASQDRKRTKNEHRNTRDEVPPRDKARERQSSVFMSATTPRSTTTAAAATGLASTKSTDTAPKMVTVSRKESQQEDGVAKKRRKLDEPTPIVRPTTLGASKLSASSARQPSLPLRTPSPTRSAATQPSASHHQTQRPASKLRPESLSPSTYIPITLSAGTVEHVRPPHGVLSPPRAASLKPSVKGVGPGAANWNEPWLNVRSRSDWHRLAQRFERAYEEYLISKRRLDEESSRIELEFVLAMEEKRIQDGTLVEADRENHTTVSVSVSATTYPNLKSDAVTKTEPHPATEEGEIGTETDDGPPTAPNSNVTTPSPSTTLSAGGLGIAVSESLPPKSNSQSTAPNPVVRIPIEKPHDNHHLEREEDGNESLEEGEMTSDSDLPSSAFIVTPPNHNHPHPHQQDQVLVDLISSALGLSTDTRTRSASPENLIWRNCHRLTRSIQTTPPPLPASASIPTPTPTSALLPPSFSSLSTDERPLTYKELALLVEKHRDLHGNLTRMHKVLVDFKARRIDPVTSNFSFHKNASTID